MHLLHVLCFPLASKLQSETIIAVVVVVNYLLNENDVSRRKQLLDSKHKSTFLHVTRVSLKKC